MAEYLITMRDVCKLCAGTGENTTSEMPILVNQCRWCDGRGYIDEAVNLMDVLANMRPKAVFSNKNGAFKPIRTYNPLITR